MSKSGNFNPEWGYPAPVPGFLRTARVVLVATAVGAAAGAGVVFSLVGHPAEEISVAAHTMFRPVEAVSARADASPLAVQTNTHFPTQHRSEPPLAVNGQSASTPSSESSASSTTQAPEGGSALAEAAAPTDAPAKAAIAAPSAADKPPVVIAAPIKKRAMKKPYVTWRYASRDEPLGFAPGEYDTRRSYHASGARGGYYRDGGRWETR
jgi:hypothetical protein